MQRLESDEIITGKVALVDQNKIGLGLSVFVSVESDDHSDTWLRKFASVVSAMPEVIEFYRMAGDVDYVLRVVVADMHSYDLFYKKLIGAIALKNVTSRFAMEKIKSVTALPVPALDAGVVDCGSSSHEIGDLLQRLDLSHRTINAPPCSGSRTRSAVDDVRITPSRQRGASSAVRAARQRVCSQEAATSFDR